MSMQIAPYRDAVAVTPSDATIIPVTRGLFIGGAGNINVRTVKGTTILLSGITANTVLPLAVDMVLAATTTATLIRALY
jgi:hypothetical protein